jgi:hypothetical protein
MKININGFWYQRVDHAYVEDCDYEDEKGKTHQTDRRYSHIYIPVSE